MAMADSDRLALVVIVTDIVTLRKGKSLSERSLNKAELLPVLYD
jgi:hypothetical protein